MGCDPEGGVDGGKRGGGDDGEEEGEFGVGGEGGNIIALTITLIIT